MFLVLGVCEQVLVKEQLGRGICLFVEGYTFVDTIHIHVLHIYTSMHAYIGHGASGIGKNHKARLPVL